MRARSISGHIEWVLEMPVDLLFGTVIWFQCDHWYIANPLAVGGLSGQIVSLDKKTFLYTNKFGWSAELVV